MRELAKSAKFVTQHYRKMSLYNSNKQNQYQYTIPIKDCKNIDMATLSY